MSGVNTLRRQARAQSRGPQWCKQKFLHYFPRGFRDPTYLDWERSYKWRAHESWASELSQSEMRKMIDAGEYERLAGMAMRIESRTNLLFSFEKMALRDAVKTRAGAQHFSTGMYDFLHGRAATRTRFERWCEVIGDLPRRQTRVLTWPLVTVFGFIAQPELHVFLKPTVTRIAAEAYGHEFRYMSRPNWDTYLSLLEFASDVLRTTRSLKPRDMIDAQGFIWVAGSDEYPNKRRWK
jgi:hypothetical protein